MGSEECQTKAGATGTFFPSIPTAMDNTVTSMKSQGVDLSVFNQYVKDGRPLPLHRLRQRVRRPIRRTAPHRGLFLRQAIR